MKLAEEADGKQREVLYAQAPKRPQCRGQTARTRKPTIGAREAASRLLGRWRRRRNPASSSEARKASDDAVKAEALAGGAAARQAKVDAIARRKPRCCGRTTNDRAAAAAARLRRLRRRTRPAKRSPISRWTAQRRRCATRAYSGRGATPPPGWAGFGRARGSSSAGLSPNFSPFGPASGTVHRG